MLEPKDKTFLKALVFTTMSEKSCSDIKNFSDKVDDNYKALRIALNGGKEPKPFTYNNEPKGSI